MILWFLRLFPQFRQKAEACDNLFSAELDIASLRAANEELIAEKNVLEVRLDAALEDRNKLWDAMQNALAGERMAYHMQINHAVQRSGGGIPYPDAHSLPPSVTRVQEPGAVGRRGRELPSEAAAKQTDRFLQEMIRPREGK